MKLKQCLRVSALLVAASSTAFATSASAGGLYIWEFGQPNQGASGAGAGALALDASTVFMNPAGITWLEQPERMATGIIIDSTVKFSQDPAAALRPPAVPDGNGERPAGNGGDAGSTALGAAFAFAKHNSRSLTRREHGTSEKRENPVLAAIALSLRTSPRLLRKVRHSLFFRISFSSRASANSLRKREFSASKSVTDRPPEETIHGDTF